MPFLYLITTILKQRQELVFISGLVMQMIMYWSGMVIY